MTILNINKIAVSFGFGSVLNDVSFSINQGEKVAVVGNNGSGKSTLLKIIAGIENSNFGNISLKKGTRVEYLEQGDNSDVKVGRCIDILYSTFNYLKPLQNELTQYENLLNQESDADKLDVLVKRYCAIQEKFVELGGYDIENQINYVVNGLKIDKKLLLRDFNTLSGGERTLINFAKILLGKPELLLLDEPTNHLDIERVEWLEQFIKDYKGTIIIVSHDRYFLDRTISKIIEIDNGKAKIYYGNYTKYLEQKQAEETKEFEQYKQEQKKIAEMEKAIKRLKEWGEMADNPTFFRRAKAIQSALDRIKENAIEKPKQKIELPMEIINSGRASQEVVRLKDFSLSAGNKNLLSHSYCLIENGEKVAILGKNGCGKTTLIKTILGDQGNADISISGELKLGSNQNIGYLSQIIEFYNNNSTLLWTFMNELGIDEQYAKSTLYKFQFYKDDWTKIVSTLSGGEKLRLKLAIMLQKKLNFLVLDEPTNHIDITTREVLEENLKEFKGTILFVSHDRYFINSIATKILAVENCQIKTYCGNYDFYISERDKRKF